MQHPPIPIVQGLSHSHCTRSSHSHCTRSSHSHCTRSFPFPLYKVFPFPVYKVFPFPVYKVFPFPVYKVFLIPIVQGAPIPWLKTFLIPIPIVQHLPIPIVQGAPIPWLKTFLIPISIVKVIKAFQTGYCQPPPPGCPRGVYSTMVSCWWVLPLTRTHARTHTHTHTHTHTCTHTIHIPHHRNPDYHGRLSFAELHDKLTRDPETLLAWSGEEKGVSPQAATLGAPLLEGRELYGDLCSAYKGHAIN